MKRIKTVGLIIGAALALTALGASSATAAQFRAEEYPTTVAGAQITEFALGTNGTKSPIKTKCSKVTFAGVESEASSAMTVTPTLSGCKTAGVSSTPSVNSCYFVFHSTNEEAPFVGGVDVTCSKENDTIDFAVPGLECTIKIPAQNGLGSVAYSNSGSSRSRAITATLNLTGLRYIYSGKGCPGGSGTFENGTYSGSAVFSGVNEAAKHAVGVYLANEQVEDPPLFESETYPAIVEGTQQSETGLSINVLNTICNSFLTSGELEGPAGELTQSVRKWECGHTSPIKMNGCYFTFHPLFGEVPFASGTLGIACSKIGAAITFTAWGACPVQIPAQSNLTGLSFENTGTGASRAVHVGVAVSGLEYIEAAPSCISPGTHKNGALTGSWNLKGFEIEGYVETPEGKEAIPGNQVGTWVL